MKWKNGVAEIQRKRGKVFKIRYRVPLVPGHDPTRQVVETLKHCANRKQAEGVLAQRMASVFEGTYRPRNQQKPIMLTEFIGKYLETRKNELAAWDSYDRSLRKHVVPFMGERYLFEVNTAMCEDYRRHRLEQGAAPATARKELRYLQSVYVEARKRGHVSHDPVSDVSFKRIDNARTRMPSPIEIAKLARTALALDRGDFMRPLFITLMCTGFRITSALELRWEHVDLDEHTLKVKQKGDTWVYPPMTSLLRAELEHWQPVSRAIGKDGFVFPALRGAGAMNRGTAKKHWIDLIEKAGVSGLTFHDIRRWVVTAMKKHGADSKVIGTVSGQATAAIIDRYDQGARERAATIMEAVTDLKLISDGEKREDDNKQRRNESAAKSA